MSPFLRPFADRAGRFSPLKTGAFALAAAPTLWFVALVAGPGLGPRPLSAATHEAGLATLRLVALTLAVTPLRLALRRPNLVSTRRIFGVWAFAYGLAHVAFYVASQHFDLWRVGDEIVRRVYLAIGVCAFLMLSALAVTSTDAMIARLGSARWRRLHRAVYAIAVLGCVHFFMQSKLDVSQAIMMSGIFALLLAFRLAAGAFGDLSAGMIALVGAACAATTALFEAGWFAWSAGAPFDRALASNLDFSYMVRPAWFVLAVGGLLTFARLARAAAPRASGRPRLARKTQAAA
ncbi:sulfite oxidase heme-binding subunit YedZ [Methylocella sp.]|uniref:sulfite oxidase heme-binding subunit YedZ n=1 Tax=Methylocella sp. TaxID=1978226 RepID=UPI0035ADFC94